MLKKGDKTKQSIISESKKLFSKRGYATVTMKDICEICDLSRGGLYRYFGSTKEIFIEILNEDKEDAEKILRESIANNVSAIELLQAFLHERKITTILGDSQGLVFAIQEFAHIESDHHDYMRERCQSAVSALSLLLQYGQEQGDFKCFDVHSTALHILLLLDSLESNAKVLGFSEEVVDSQFNILYSLVV